MRGLLRRRGACRPRRCRAWSRSECFRWSRPRRRGPRPRRGLGAASRPRRARGRTASRTRPSWPPLRAHHEARRGRRVTSQTVHGVVVVVGDGGEQAEGRRQRVGRDHGGQRQGRAVLAGPHERRPRARPAGRRTGRPRPPRRARRRPAAPTSSTAPASPCQSRWRPARQPATATPAACERARRQGAEPGRAPSRASSPPSAIARSWPAACGLVVRPRERSTRPASE